MHPLSRFLIPALALAVVAGCAAPGQNGGSTTEQPTAQNVEVELTRVPEDPVTTGTPTTVSWSAGRNLGEGQTIQTNHTSVHFGPQSVENPTAPEDYPQTGTVFCEQVPCTLPDDFNSPITVTTPGTYYIRAHAMIDGQHVWSTEEQFEVQAATGQPTTPSTTTPTPPTTPETTTPPATTTPGPGAAIPTAAASAPTTRTIEISAANWDFAPQQITAKKGERVKLVLTNDTGRHGLAIPDLGIDIKPTDGATTGSAEFVADKAGSFAFRCSIPCGDGHRTMTGTLNVTA